jgi:hypothetical protein
MDGKMKGMIMAGMMALSLILGAMAIFSNAWLTEEEEDESVTNYGLNTMEGVSEAESADECKAQKEFVDMMYEDVESYESECDGAEFTMTLGISDLCELMEKMEVDGDDLDDCEASASAGTMGTIGMWGGVVLALVATLMMVLPMAGVDAMDAIPEMGQKVISWGAGGLMLLGMVLWYFMLPDGDASMGTGLWIAGAAMSIGLGSTLIGQFIPADE